MYTLSFGFQNMTRVGNVITWKHSLFWLINSRLIQIEAEKSLEWNLMEQSLYWTATWVYIVSVCRNKVWCFKTYWANPRIVLLERTYHWIGIITSLMYTRTLLSILKSFYGSVKALYISLLVFWEELIKYLIKKNIISDRCEYELY